MEPERNGKYALVGPVKGGYDWWSINDMEEMYAVVTVQAKVPQAERIIRFAWDLLPKEQA